MRILHVVHSFPPDSLGGTETYVQDIAHEQVRRGHAPTILAGCDERRFDELSRRESYRDLDVVRLRAPVRDLGRLAGVDSALREAFLATLRSDAFDAVHLHHWHNLSSDLVRAALAVGVPSVVTLHDYFATCPFFFRLPDGQTPCPPDLERATCVACVGRIAGDAPQVLDAALAEREQHMQSELASAAAVVVLSQFQRDFLRAYPSFREIDFRVLGLPVPAPPEAPPESAPVPAPQSELNLVSWGGLDRAKGLSDVVAAIALLDEPQRVALHHFGRILNDQYPTELEAQSRGPLRIHGAYERSELPSFAGFDLAVFPSLFLETHGYVVDEALQLGLPVVVSDRGAPQERIGERGVRVPAGDVQALANVLERALNEPAWLGRLRSAPRQARAGLEQHVEELTALYASHAPS